MHVVYSTITCDTEYVSYRPGKPTDASSVLNRRVRIKGGANLAPLKGQLITPRGAATVVDDKTMEFLEANEAFRRHKEKGFITVEKGNKPRDLDVITKEMAPKDASAPITKDTIGEFCAGLENVNVVVEETESSKARMK